MYCGAFGFGQNGPYADRPTYDNPIQAAGPAHDAGAQDRRPADLRGHGHRGPCMVGMATSANAILAALHWRSQTGAAGRGGADVRDPRTSDGRPLRATASCRPSATGATSDRAWSASPTARPTATLPAWEVYTDWHWQRLFAAVGRADVAEDPRYADVHASARGHISELCRLPAPHLRRGRPPNGWRCSRRQTSPPSR